MGVAARHRGDTVIARRQRSEGVERDERDQFRRLIAAEADADEWRREAWAFWVDKSTDGRGLLGGQMREMAAENGRVLRSRCRKVMEAHRAWLDVHAHDQWSRTAASQAWARAVHRLLAHVTWGWSCDVLDRAPRACRSK